MENHEASASRKSTFDSLANTKDIYVPSKETAKNSYVDDYNKLYDYSIKENEKFWDETANQLDWFRRWDKVLDSSNPPFYKWFTGGKTNIVHNALDRHIATFRKNKLAIIWEGEDGSERLYTYFSLYKEVNKFANVLKSFGIKKGDTVTIYLPNIPEIAISMLACAKIGAVHSVVYAGFSALALKDRILDAQSKLLITSDGAFRGGKVIELKKIADEAVTKAPVVQTVIVVKRTGKDVFMDTSRDFYYDELMKLPIANPYLKTEELDSEDPLFILYTSGTTGKPKGILHVHGGYSVGTYITSKYVFNIKDNDTYWCAADPGWITGHSYIIYGPLINGATTLMVEGSPYYPYPDRWWRIVEKHGVNIFYTSPTAVRGVMRFGENWPNRHNLSSLKILGSVGEPINPEVWRWYYKHIGKERCPIMDTWWQTESGMFLITPVPTMSLKPGSCGKPFFGIDADIFDENGKSVKAGKGGYLVVKKPWPAMMRTIYKDENRYKETYFSKFEGAYLAGDTAKRDEDGYFYVMGRIDDVIKVSGYRLGTAEIESAIITHESVAESAVIGKQHDVKGNAIKAFIVLKPNIEKSDALADDIKANVGKTLGPIAKPDEIEFVDSLPKTRSGKIMRRVLKAREMGIDEGDLSTIEED